ncbi:conserved hypothetical protein [Clostridium botulinum C str. Eklund]|nr:conserved hypothetical protein [Clostridium botulinum C str. Eklund]
MVLEVDDYKIITDDKQFIVQKKRIVQAGRLTKKENIGKEYWSDIKYYSSLNSALKFIRKTVLLDNDDLKVIMDKLEQLEHKIDEFANKLGEE